MATSSRDKRGKEALLREIEELRARLDEAEQTLDAIRSGDVDALVVAGPGGDLVFSLTGAERTYRLIVETMNEAALTVDLSGNILFCNKRFSTLLKRPMAEAMGQNVTAFVAPAQQPALQKFLAEAQAGPVQRSLKLRAADGSAVSVRLAASPLVEGDNTSICLVVSDLTELEAQADSIRIMHEYQQALEESKAELQASNALLSQSRLTALNVAEDAIAARRQAEEAVAELQREVIERKRFENSLKESDLKYRALFNNGLTGLAYCRIVLDEHGQPTDYIFLDVNDTFVNLTGLKREAVRGHTAREVMPGIEKSEFDLIGIHGRVALGGEEAAFEQYVEQLQRWYSVFVYSPQKEYFVSIFSDITQRKQAGEQLRASLAEKEVMLREIHHRVKNNLQVMGSLLTLQMSRVRDPPVRAALAESVGRVHAIGLVHQTLYDAGAVINLPLGHYLRALAGQIGDIYDGLLTGTISVSGANPSVPLETAVPLALIVHEVVANIALHAFPAAKDNRVEISVEDSDGQWRITIADNGVGLPEGFDWNRSARLGLQIVRSLASQIGARISLTSDGGTRFTLTMPAPQG